jgi:hypothetical protein
MKYMLAIYHDEAAMKCGQSDAQVMAAHQAYTEALKKAGAFLAVNALQPSSTATTVRVKQGRTEVLDGPYAEAKEQLAGYYLIEVADLDTAIAWAARCPDASIGRVEVRPIFTLPF